MLVLPMGALQAQQALPPGVNLPDSIKPGASEPRRLLDEPRFFEDADGLAEPADPGRQAPAADAPRFRVTGVRLSGVVDNEDLGIRRADLERLVDESLNGRERLSLEELRALADDVTRYYRARGYLLAQAYVPKQTVEDGVVEIRLIPGMLGRVSPVDNEEYELETLEKPFRSLFDNPVIKEEVETALLVLKDFPGLAASAVFSRGERPGTADLKLLVEDEDAHEFYVNLDDYGSEYLGRYRARLDWVWNNPTGHADQLVIAGLQTVDPDNSAYGAVDYRVPWFPGKWRTPLFVGLGASYNDFDVGDQLEALGLNGETQKASLFAIRDFKRTRTVDVTGELRLDRKRAITRVGEAEVSRDELAVYVGSLRVRAQDAALFGQPGVTRLGIDWSRGVGDHLGSMLPENDPESSRTGGSGLKAGGDFDKANLRLDRLQRFGRAVSMLFRLNGQWSDDLLVSLEQFPMGGPDSVRAYPLSAFLADSGYFASLEFAFDPPSDPYRTGSSWLGRLWRDALSFSVFADYAEGDINDPLPNGFESVSMAGAGLGLQLSITDRFRLLISAARPFGTRPPGFEDEDGTRYFVAMSLRL